MKANRRGFTLVELTIAIAFIGILLIAVVTTAIALGRTYQKGTSLRDVNQIGREVMDGMRRDIAAASPSQLKVIALPSADNPETMRLCTGSVSYIINLAEHLNTEGGQFVRMAESNQPARLVRVVDGGGANCVPGGNGQYSLSVIGTNQQELLTDQEEGGSNNIAVHALEFTEVGGEDESRLYNLLVRLGTNDVSTTNEGRCVEPTDSASNFDFCALYDFETVIRAGYRSEE